MPEFKFTQPVIPMLGGMLASLAGTIAFGRLANEHLKSLPNVRGTPSTFAEVKKDQGLNVGYLHDPRIAGHNAFYVPKDVLIDRLKEPDLEKATTKQLTQMLRKAKQHGLVITGTGFKKPGIIEHELGHAIATHSDSPWDKFTHSSLAPGIGFLGWLAGIASGHYMGSTRGMRAGALTGLGVSGLGAIPMISREMTADRYGHELMDPEKVKQEKTWPFIAGYANPLITFPTVAGALSGLGHHFPRLLVPKL